MGTALDITARKVAEAQLEHDAFFDGLTGLPNRALLMDRLRQAVARATRNPHVRFALFFIDLDDFKMVNDSWGHEVGDLLIVEASRRLTACLRAEDTLARIGGDEFVVLMGDVTDETDVVAVASRLHAGLEGRIAIRGHDTFVTASIGIALSEDRLEGDPELLRKADTAMYEAKGLGKGRSALFNQTMHARAVQRLQLQSQLRDALLREEFVVQYQPIVDIEATGLWPQKRYSDGSIRRGACCRPLNSSRSRSTAV